MRDEVEVTDLNQRHELVQQGGALEQAAFARELHHRVPFRRVCVRVFVYFVFVFVCILNCFILY